MCQLALPQVASWQSRSSARQLFHRVVVELTYLNRPRPAAATFQSMSAIRRTPWLLMMGSVKAIGLQLAPVNCPLLIRHVTLKSKHDAKSSLCISLRYCISALSCPAFPFHSFPSLFSSSSSGLLLFMSILLCIANPQYHDTLSTNWVRDIPCLRPRVVRPKSLQNHGSRAFCSDRPRNHPTIVPLPTNTQVCCPNQPMVPPLKPARHTSWKMKANRNRGYG